MMNRYLLLWLEGPLQAWGADSRFGRRDTLNFPTKSGVLGLLCSALGAGGEQRELLREMAPLTQTALAFRKTTELDEGTRIARDAEPLLRDFHMVGSAYDEKDPWQDLMIPKKSNGERAVGGGTKITYRNYLQDSVFAAVVEVPGARAESFAKALAMPCWDLFLGRKCCAPTDIIFRGSYDTREDALLAAVAIAEEKHLIEAFRVVDGEEEGEALTLNDVPVQFGERKQYRERLVTILVSDGGQ